MRAPPGKEVEDLTPIDVLKLLCAEAPAPSRRERASERAQPKAEEADEPVVA